MNTASIARGNLEQVNLALDASKLETLLYEGKLHAADFQCLDPVSKKSVWRMLLSAAVTQIGRQ
jgi:hypothetical protein